MFLKKNHYCNYTKTLYRMYINWKYMYTRINANDTGIHYHILVLSVRIKKNLRNIANYNIHSA
jgi:hypothetical protein